MHKIIIQKECGCFKRSNLQNNQVIESKDEALTKAIEIKNKMNDEFCKKHEFDLVEFQNDFIINFAQQKVGNCCGGGHCS